MTTSLKTFRNNLTQGMLNFVWRQWCQMGVFGSMREQDDWVIDPEAILAFTSEVGRHDARVFDEVLDWLLRNGQWINVQRLSTIVQRDNIGDKAVIGAVASWMTEHGKPAKWRGLARRMECESRNTPEVLFHFMKKGLPASAGKSDPHFARYGLLRQAVETRHMTQPVNMRNPVNAAFKCRALFGIGNRADVMLYLLTTAGGHPRRIAHLLGYNPMRIQELLVGLAEAGAVTMRPVGRTKTYWIDREKWWPAVMGRSDAPRWVDWRALTRGLTAIWRQTWAIDEERANDYIFSSKMRTAVQAARDDLHASGIGFDIEDDRGYIAEDYLPALMQTVTGTLTKLNPDRGEE